MNRVIILLSLIFLSCSDRGVRISIWPSQDGQLTMITTFSTANGYLVGGRDLVVDITVPQTGDVVGSLRFSSADSEIPVTLNLDLKDILEMNNFSSDVFLPDTHASLKSFITPYTRDEGFKIVALNVKNYPHSRLYVAVFPTTADRWVVAVSYALSRHDFSISSDLVAHEQGTWPAKFYLNDYPTRRGLYTDVEDTENSWFVFSHEVGEIVGRFLVIRNSSGFALPESF